MVLAHDDGEEDFDVQFARGLCQVCVVRTMIGDRVTNTTEDLVLSVAMIRTLTFASFNILNLWNDQK